MRRDIQILDRVKSAYSSLRPSEQKVADCILNDPEGCTQYTLSLYDFRQYAGVGFVLCEECSKSGGYHLQYQRRRPGRCLDGGSGGRKLPVGVEPAGIPAVVH